MFYLRWFMRAGIFCFGFVAARVNFFCKTDVIKLHNFNQGNKRSEINKNVASFKSFAKCL